MNKKINFIKFIKRGGIVFLISLFLVLIGYEIINTYHDFNLRSEGMRKEYMSQQKNMLKQEVKHVVDFINYKKAKVAIIDEQFRKDILETISIIRFGQEGYIFINQFDGNALISNGKILSGDKKLWEVFTTDTLKTKNLFQKEHMAAMKSDGEFIYYSFIKLIDSNKEFPKVSFVYGIPSLQWLVGAGVYLDSIEKDIALMKNDLIIDLLKNLFYTILILIIIISLFLFLFNFLFNNLRNDLDQFNLFFKSAAYKDEPIDLEKIKFVNFENMAKNANNMLQDKITAQKALRDEREQLFVTIRSVGDGLITTNASGKVELMNTVAEKLTGWKNEEAKGKSLEEIFEIINESSRIKVENPVNRVLIEHNVIGLANHTILISKDGTEYNIADSAAPIKDINNNVLGVVLVFRDITTEYKMLDDLRKSKERYSRLSSLTYEGILIHRNGIAKDVNKALEKITGYSSDELIGQNIIQLLIPEKYHEMVIKNQQQNITKAYEIEGIRKDGKNFPLEVESKLIDLGDGNSNTRVTAIRDITEKKAMMYELVKSKKNAENANKMKDIFLAQMSHEIRTPINALVSMASLLRYDFEEIATEDQIMSFDIIDRAGGRIIRTVDLLLNLSEIQAETYEANMTRFDLYADVLSSVVTENRKIAEKKNIKLTLNCSTPDTELIADSYTVNQIFSQLIDNAIKYTKMGDVKIIIRTNSENKLVVEIKDTGIGIDEKYLPNLFEPFSQEEMGFTRKYEGNGIGMALVKKYCELNKAKIEVESIKDVGSTFRIIFL